MDYGAWRFWFDVAQTICFVFVAVYTYLMNRTKANRAAIQQVDQRVTHLTERVGQLENDVRHLPDHDDLGAIHEKVNVVAAGMGEIKGELGAINRTLGLINEYLLKGSRDQ